MIHEKMPVVDGKRLVMLNIPYVIVFYLVDKIAWLYRHCIGDSLIVKAGVLFLNFQMAFENPLPSLHGYDLLAGIGGAIIVKLIVYMKGKNAKKYRQGEEYGSARWGTPKDIAPFIDPVFENNILLTQTERLTMESRPKLPKYARNKNVIVIGGSGSGKTRFYVKPQLMQMPQKVSFCVTDPKGTILVECGEMLKRGTPKMNHGKPVRDKNGKVVYEPYKIKVLNTINFKKSMHYNPFQYIRSEKDILKLVNTIIANTKGEGEKSSEDFWVKAERLLYCALIGYIYYEAPEEEQNFSTLLEFINASETREDDEEFKNAVDELFEELEREKPEHFAVRQYRKFKLAAGKTSKSILISCGARLAPFDIAELRELTSYDEMELDMIGDQRTAMFIIISDTDDTFNFIVAIMYTQLFNLLCDRADDVHGGRLPYHVRLLLDEFSNIGQIPKFDKLIATIRSREISASIILQSQSQLKTIYKDAAETILGNCDTMLFLGGKEGSTLKEISETLGKETIDLYNTSDTRGQSRSYGLNYQKTGKELMSRDELAVMDGNKCILQLRGVRPFLSDKFDITRHKRYKELSDYDKKNAFDVEAYMKHPLKIRMKEEFDLYEVDGSEGDSDELEEGQ
ncbi:type IV secretory system conjugative DNA transfer family protein [Lachnospiraceae bacterium MD308]|nr:type IV secretory system conjugative DNA transfer family protein [Lachnospiraceae bacterium MD308]